MEESGAKPPIQPIVNAKTPQKKPDQKNAQPPINPPPDPNRMPPPAHEAKRENCRPDQTPLAKHILEVLAVGIGACYTLAAIWQLAAMNGQLSMMQDNLKLERPWIGATKREVIFHKTTKRIAGVHWYFKNGGRSPATEVRMKIEFMLGPPPSFQPGLPENVPLDEVCAKGPLPTDFGHNVALPGIDTYFTSAGLSQEMIEKMDDINRGKIGLYLIGCLDYSDATRKPWYRTNVSEFLRPPMDIVVARFGNDAQ